MFFKGTALVWVDEPVAVVSDTGRFAGARIAGLKQFDSNSTDINNV